jgi:phosphohistidine phosphatase
MKTVVLIRHAKSSWDDHSMTDLERPLNDRGKKDAPEMAQRLLKKKIAINAFISSPAKRARKTATIFAKAFDREKEDVLLKDKLYNAAEKDFYEVISQLPASMNNIALFSHNPGLTDFANTLTSDTRIDNVPTCGMFAVTFDGDWSTFRQAQKQFLFFDYPKSVFD